MAPLKLPQPPKLDGAPEAAAKLAKPERGRAHPADVDEIPDESDWGPPPWRRRLLVTAIFVVAEMVMIRRTPGQLSHRLLGNLGDPALIIWTMRWDGHAMLQHAVWSHPLTLFNANIYWPATHTLAYADDLISISPFYNALYALTHNWTLSLNLLWLGELGLNMGATYSLTRWLTRRTEAGILAGLAAGFSAFVWSQIGHPQLQIVGLIPLGLLLLFKLLERPGIARAVALGVVNLVILLGASYWTVAYAVAVVVILGGWLIVTRGRIGWPLVIGLAVAGVVTLLALPTFLPYRQVESAQGKRGLAPQWSLRPRDIIRATPGSYLYAALARDTSPGAGERHLFPGFSTIALAAVGAGSLALGWRRTRRRRRPAAATETTADPASADPTEAVPWTHHLPPAGHEGPAPPARSGPRDRRTFLVLLIAAGLAIAVLAAGSNTHGIWTPWNFMYDHVPGFAGIRVTARLAEVTLIIGAVLAGAGLDTVLRRLPTRATASPTASTGAGPTAGTGAGPTASTQASPKASPGASSTASTGASSTASAAARIAITALACVVVLVELAGPLAWVPLPSDPSTLAVYQALRHRPAGAVVELPIADPVTDTNRWSYTEPPRMVWSTIDWHPRLNGYSGYLSPNYPADTEVLATLPSASALNLLQQRHIRYLIVHVGQQAGFPMFTEDQAHSLLSGLPPADTATRYGPNYLVDLGSQ